MKMYKRIYFLLILITGLLYSCGTTSRSTAPATKPTVVAYKWHTLTSNSSIAGLAKEFNTPVKDLRALNPQISDPLKSGQRIKLPLNAIRKTDGITTIMDTVKVPVEIDPIDKYPLDLLPPKVFDIALLLPFNLDAASHISSDGSVVLDPVSQICIEYYQGVLIALDSLKNSGLSVNLKVFDTFSDSVSISQFLNNPLMKAMDLVIGPAYSANLNKVADFCQENSIPFVSPVSSSPVVTVDHPLAFQLIPSASNQVKLFCEYMLNKHKRASYLILHGDSKLERDLSDIYKSCLLGKDSLNNPKIAEYSTGYLKSSEIENRLKLSSKNIIIIPSSDQAFVASTLSKLIDLRSKYDITVMGLPTWENFDAVDLRKLDLLDVHYFTTNFVDFKDSRLLSFRMKFTSRFKTDPSVSSIQGYDTMWLFGNALLRHGKEFDSKNFSEGAVFMHNGLNFIRTNEKDGFENLSIKVLSFDNLTLRSEVFTSKK